MDDLIAFIKARLDEDEAAAVAAAKWGTEGIAGRAHWVNRYGMVTDSEDPDWAVTDLAVYGAGDAVHAHIARHDPARVLREVAAKREILAEHTSFTPAIGWNKGQLCCTCCGAGHDDVYLTVSWPCDTIKALAAVWIGHPDYPGFSGQGDRNAPCEHEE